MTVRENLEMGAFSRPRQDLTADFERVFDLFPVLKEREAAAGRHAVRRRAADAGDGPRADGAARSS